MVDGESEGARLDRELSELLQELRVILPGVQVLLAFLLTAPFQQRFAQVGHQIQKVYFAAVCCAVLAVVLLLAPSAHHRMRFREHDKERLVRLANRLTLVGTVFLAAAIVLALYVVTRVLFHAGAAAAVAVAAAALFGGVWYVLPLLGRPGGRAGAPGRGAAQPSRGSSPRR